MSDARFEPTAEEIERVEKALRRHIITHEGENLTLSDLMSSAFGDDGDYADRALAIVAPALARAAILAMDRRASPPAEPVAVISRDWQLLWYSPNGIETLSKISERTGAQVGDKLYRASPPAPASVVPFGWARGVHQPSTPNGPAEYDVDFVYGDDEPSGDGWFPIYREPAPAVAVPEGWKLVPIQPTEAMLECGGEAVVEGYFGDRVWADMLAAAPQPPATRSYEEGKRIDRLKDAIEGECDGLAIDDASAKIILAYVDTGDVPDDLARSLKGPRDE